MNKLNNDELQICKYVANLFEYSVIQKNCSSKVFIKGYIYSSLLRRIENKAILYESIDIPLAYDEIRKEKKLDRGSEIYPSYVMAWIGFIMTYFCYSTNVSAQVLYKAMKPEEFYQIYEAYHGLDNDMVINRIVEAKKININLNNLDILKQIYLKNKV